MLAQLCQGQVQIFAALSEPSRGSQRQRLLGRGGKRAAPCTRWMTCLVPVSERGSYTLRTIHAPPCPLCSPPNCAAPRAPTSWSTSDGGAERGPRYTSWPMNSPSAIFGQPVAHLSAYSGHRPSQGEGSPCASGPRACHPHPADLPAVDRGLDRVSDRGASSAAGKRTFACAAPQDPPTSGHARETTRVCVLHRRRGTQQPHLLCVRLVCRQDTPCQRLDRQGRTPAVLYPLRPLGGWWRVGGAA